jgi:hypothetical protein
VKSNLKFSARRRDAGNVLVVVMGTVAMLALLCGAALLKVDSQNRTAYRAADWRKALGNAESGVDLAMDTLRTALKNRNVWVDRTNALTCETSWEGWMLQTIDGVVTRTLPGVSPLLTNGGSGSTEVRAEVTVDSPPSLLEPGGAQWYRIRSRGIATLSDASRVSTEKIENSLFGTNFVRSPAGLVGGPRTFRLVEVIAKPRSPFKYAFLSDEKMAVGGSSGRVDSYDSRDPAKSTNGRYDPAKFQKNGNVATNSKVLWAGGYVWGDAYANEAMPEPPNHIEGERRDDFNEELPPVEKPDWTTLTDPALTTVSKATTIAAGAVGSATRYKVSKIGGPLRIRAPSPGQPSVAEIWVTGDITSSIVSDPGVSVRIWVEGDIRLSNDTVSNSGRAANTQIYGVTPSGGGKRMIDINPNADFIAAIYAPGHDFNMRGSAEFFGSYVARSVSSNGNPKMHYDEALRDDTAYIKEYTVASWLEDSR